MADNPVSMLADRIEVTSNTSNITFTDGDKAMLLQIFNQRQKTGPPSEDTRPCTHTHTFYPRNLVPVKSSRVIHFVPWKIPTRRGYHDHESKKIVIEDGSVVEFIPYEKPDEEETLSEAIDRVNLFHGRTRWTLHWYSVDDGSERGIEMATIARDTIFRDRGYDKGGWTDHSPWESEKVEYHIPLQSYIDLTWSETSNPTHSSTQTATSRTSILQEFENHRLHVTLHYSISWAKDAKHDDTPRFYAFQEKVIEGLIESEPIDTQKLPDECCHLCGKGDCKDFVVLKACPGMCDTHRYGRKCLVEWVFEHGHCPHCAVRVD